VAPEHFRGQQGCVTQGHNRVFEASLGGEGLKLRSQGLDVDLSKVDPLSVGVFDLQNVSMRGTNNGTVAKLDGGAASPSVDPDQVTIRLNDPEIAKRFARGILHAALLCGGTKAVSPF
jgi:hypothetical protein